MGQITLTSASYAFQNYYTKDKVRFTAHKMDPLLMKIRKKEDYRGGNFNFALEYGHSGGISVSDPSYAYTNAGANNGVNFSLSQKDFFAVARIANKAILNTKGDAAAYFDLLQTAFERRMRELGWALSGALYKPADGRLGTCSSTTGGAGQVVTLTDVRDTFNFEKGMKVVTAANASSAIDSSTADTVSAVNRTTGTITISGSANGTYTANQLIFREGTYSNADTNSIHGLPDWIPSTAPSGTDIGGVDRSVDPTRLAGHRLDGSSGDLEGLIQDAIALIHGEASASPNMAVMSPGNWNKLSQDLGSRVDYNRVKMGDASVGEVGFDAIRVNGVDCFWSPACPTGNIWVLNSDSWQLASAGPAPHLDDADGSVVQRDLPSTTSGVVIRAEAYCQLVCLEPAANCNIHTLP